MKCIVVFFTLLVVSIGHALADCEYQGKYYPTGTRIGSKTCQSDGSWR